MEKDTKRTDDLKQSQSALRDNSLNSTVTAIPKDRIDADAAAADPDQSSPIEYGEMNLEDAQESGYTDSEGHAVSKARKDVPGSPTGAYTDIGAGRSSAVRHVSRKDPKDRH